MRRVVPSVLLVAGTLALAACGSEAGSARPASAPVAAAVGAADRAPRVVPTECRRWSQLCALACEANPHPCGPRPPRTTAPGRPTPGG